MAELPHLAELVISHDKIARYLLADDHPDGRGKARFFRQFGFRVSQSAELASALERHALQALVTTVTDTAFGIKYVVEGELWTPGGRRPMIRAVWFCRRHDATRLHFVTAYPLE